MLHIIEQIRIRILIFHVCFLNTAAEPEDEGILSRSTGPFLLRLAVLRKAV